MLMIFGFQDFQIASASSPDGWSGYLA